MFAPPRPLMDMTIVWTGCHWSIVVRGELDLRSGAELADIAGLLDPLAGVDFDLADVTFIDTAGWQAVITACRRVHTAGGASGVVAVSPSVLRYLELAGVAARR